MSGLWKPFVKDWNSTLLRRPQNVLSTYLASQSASWFALFSVMSSLSVGIFPPELAVGWMTSKLTRKFRQPVNVGMAAAVIKVAPALSELKVTPLMTGFVADKKFSEDVAAKRATMEEKLPFLKPGIAAGVKGAAWLQGPVDTYGLALFLSGKATGVATLVGVTLLVKQGVDVTSVLETYGLVGDAAEGAAGKIGALAAAAGCNAFLTPLHFILAVYGTKAQESFAVRVKERALLDGLASPSSQSPPQHSLETHHENSTRGWGKDASSQTSETANESRQTTTPGKEEGGGGGGDETKQPQTTKDVEDTVLEGTSMALLGVTLGVSAYAMTVTAATGASTLAAASEAAAGVADSPSPGE